MRAAHRLNRFTCAGFLICMILGLLSTNPGLPRSLAQAPTPSLAPASFTQETLPSITPGTAVSLTLPGLPAACAAKYPQAAPGEALIGVDPQTCETSPEQTQVSVDLPVIVDRPDMLAVVSVRCTGDQPCQQMINPPEGAASQISLRLNGSSLWSTNCGQESACDDSSPRRDVQVTFRVPASGVYPLDFDLSPGAVWRVSAIEIALQPLPEAKVIRGYAYSPYRDCQSPSNELSPTPDEVNEDLTHLFQASNAIRTYSSLGINPEIAAQARQLGFTIGLGVSLSEDQKKNEQEIQAAKKLAKAGLADFIIVGNEVILRQELTPAQVARYLSRVKKETGLPVAYAEVTSGFVDFTPGGEIFPKKSMAPILKAVDIVLVHIYPYWDGVSIDQGAAYVLSVYEKFKQLYPDKRVIIGETGWPSRGNPNGNAVPSAENQRRFFLEFTSLANQNGVEYFYFSPYEEPWKAPEAGQIGISWGINTPERMNKFETDSLFFPREAQAIDRAPGPIFAPIVTGTALKPVLSGTANPTGQPAAINEPFVLYGEFPPPETMSPSWWQGDINDFYVTDCSKSDPHTGSYAMQIHYDADKAYETGHVGWAGMIWEYPEENRGRMKKGLNLSQYKSLHFFARGENGGEKVAFILGGTQTGAYPSSIRQPQIMEATLTQDWQEYAFDLRGLDLSHVIDGFGWVASACKNPTGVTFYLDDIAYQTDVVEQSAVDEFTILEDGCLNAGFDLGLDTWGRQRRWAYPAEDGLKLVYPSWEQWGAAFIYVNQKTWSGKPSIDLSMFTTIEIEMRGESGGEVVSIGVKDSNDPSTGKEIKEGVMLSSTYEFYYFTLSDFQYSRYADPTRIYIPAEFVFEYRSANPVTIYVRSVKYLQ
jgi:exo-beta-1,3-glucanase (GH17 family)